MQGKFRTNLLLIKNYLPLKEFLSSALSTGISLPPYPIFLEAKTMEGLILSTIRKTKIIEGVIILRVSLS